MSSNSYAELSKQYSDKQLKSKSAINGYRKPIVDEDGHKWCNCTVPVLVAPLTRGLAYCLRCECSWYH